MRFLLALAAIGLAACDSQQPAAGAKMPVYVPLSGRTMEFDGTGRCAAGC